jgi:long-chain acyl-CoA synthetase
MNVKYLINRAVKRYGDNLAVVCMGTRRKFSEVDERSNRLANSLSNMGVKKGDRVGMLLNNSCEFIEIDFALSKAGIVRVPLNTRLTPTDHFHILTDSRANALFFHEEFEATVDAIRPNLKMIDTFIRVSQEPAKKGDPGILEYEELLANGSSDEPFETVEEDDLHTLFYTSGTTGNPKGVMLTHGSWANVALNLCLDYGPITPDDVLLNLQPLSHGAGFFVLPFFIKGATNVLIPAFDPSLVFRIIEEEKVTVLKLVPTMLYALMGSPDKARFDLSTLHSIIYGGSPIDRQKLIEAVRIFGMKLVQLYGQAEAPMCISTLAKSDHAIDGSDEDLGKLSSAGTPCTAVEVRIVDPEGKDVSVSQVGEVIVRGYHIMKGYWNLPEETAEVLRDGWVHTGDLGYFDSKGYIYLVDRKKDVIISGGFNIYSKEVEDVIASHPKVKEVAVIGVPDDKWGEAVKAIVVPKDGERLTEKEIINFCRDRIAHLKKPKTVDFIRELPRNPYGKVMKMLLKDPYWKNQSRKIH